MTSDPTRRQFLGTTAAAAVTAATRPRIVAAAPGPNETINLALIGCGRAARTRSCPPS